MQEICSLHSPSERRCDELNIQDQDRSVMKTFSQDSHNDIRIGSDGQFVTVDGLDAYSTVISDVVRTVRGELQLDTERGVPYFETVFKSVNGIDIWKSDVRKIVNGLSFVKSIVSFDVSWDPLNRKLNYEMVVETDEGKVTVGQSL